MDIKVRIGERIRVLREERGMAQKDLAFGCDLDRSYIASVERGMRNVSIVNIEKIACALNVSLKDFFDNGEFGNAARGGEED